MNRARRGALLLVVLLAACSSGPKSSAAVLEVAGPNPSKTAKMICQSEVREDLAAALGVDARRISKPTWNVGTHTYSCAYEYAGGAMIGLVVKEMSSVAETTAYFDELAARLGKTGTLDIGEGAFHTSDGSLVVRKDYKVLLVDVSRLPARFGRPHPSDRNLVASNVGTLIMACWKEV